VIRTSQPRNASATASTPATSNRCARSSPTTWSTTTRRPDQGPGPQGFIDFFTTLRTAFPDAHIEAEQLVVDDDHVAIAYTLTGTHQGVFRGVSGTGHKVKVRGVQVARFVGGRIVERWGSTDELGILAQIDAA